jgi:hypothetical protein
MRDIIGEMRWGMMGGGYAGHYWRDEVGYDGRGICGTDHLPEIGPAGLPFFGPTPPRLQRLGDRNGKRSTSRKRNAYFVFNLLIINHINQYFNIRLHLIRFITYNRRIFIAKYLFENKTYIIFAM